MFECKQCGEAKVRTKVGTYKAGGSIFVDDQDRAWNGRTCPPCQHSNIAARRAQSPRRHYRKRLKEETSGRWDPREYGQATVLFAPKLRACQTCKVMNVNYFECDSCRSVKFEPGCFDEDMYSVDTGNTTGAGFRW